MNIDTEKLILGIRLWAEYKSYPIESDPAEIAWDAWNKWVEANLTMRQRTAIIQICSMFSK